MAPNASSSERDLLQAIWAGLEDGCLLVDYAGKISAANAKACYLTGYSQEELFGLALTDLMLDPDTLLRRKMGLTLLRGKKTSIESVWVDKGGTSTLMQMTALPVDLRGETRALVTFSDAKQAGDPAEFASVHIGQLEDLYLTSALMITEPDVQKLLDRIVEQVCALTDATIASIYIDDAAAAELELVALHGYDEVAQGSRISYGQGITGHSFLTRQTVNVGRLAESPHPIDMSSVYHLDENEFQNVAVLALPLLYQDDALGVLVMAQDANGRRFGPIDEQVGRLLANQISLALVQSRLHAKVRATSENLARANQELRQIDQMKDDLMTMVSHELQQPLATARLGLDLVLQDQDSLAQTQTVLLRRAVGSIDTLNELVTDLLYLVDLRGPVAASDDMVDLGVVVRGVFGLMAPTARAKGLTIELQDSGQPIMCQVAPRGLQRVVEHLITNAIKFTPSGNIEIRIVGDVVNGEGILCVSDTGIGISAEQERLIFEPFYQAEGSSSRGYDGLGLGLALVRRIAEIYGGRIVVDSVRGRGSSFTLSFPLAH